MKEQTNFRKLRLDRRFAFGENRGKEGNGKFKRQFRATRARKSKPFICKRKHPYKTNALSDLLVEHSYNELLDKDEYLVSFKKKPLVGKCFIGQVVKYLEEKSTKVGHDILDKMEDFHDNMSHIGGKIGEITKKKEETDDPVLIAQYNAQIDAYQKEHDNLYEKAKKYSKLGSKLSKEQRSYPLIKLKKIRLRVIEVVEFDKYTNSYTCIAEPT